MNANTPASDDRVNSVRRALSLLDSFAPEDGPLPLAELCRRACMPKSSVLRLLRTLADAGYVVQAQDAGWRLGPRAVRLAGCYEGALDRMGVIRTTITTLAANTRKAATFFVLEGDVRVLLLKVQYLEGDVPLHVGQPRPLDRGAAGKVILAQHGRRGSPFDAIRRRGFDFTLGEVTTTIASLAAAVTASRTVLGSVCLSVSRTSRDVDELEASAPAVIAAAQWLSSALTNARLPPAAGGRPAATWHP